MLNMQIRLLVFGTAALCCVTLGAEETVFGVPLKPDPPFAIDGDLGDWGAVPNAMTLGEAAQVVWGPGTWTSPQDLSGTVRIAWRHDHLFVAVEVVDDAVSQSQRGSNLWKGDHIEVYLDAQPELGPQRDIFGEGQFQLGFSPGNFLNTGDPLIDCAPEAYCFRPRGTVLEGAVVAAARTPAGYTLEIAVPWAALGVPKPAEGMPISFEIGLSDTDGSEAQQEALMTTSTATWRHARSRLTPAALAGTDGVAKPAAHGVPIFDELELARGEQATFTFGAPATPPGRDAVVTMLARLHSGKVAGYTAALRLSLNGQTISHERLRNKPLRVKSRAGRVYSMAAGDRFSTYYSPNFTSPDIHPYYGLLDGVRPCLFEFNVTDLVQEGENTLVVMQAAAESVDNVMFAAEARIDFRLPPPPPKEKAGPPKGPLPRIEPRAKPATKYTLEELPEGKLELTVGGDTFVVESRFSTPKPGWVSGSCEYFDHERRVERRPEAVVVYDTFTNLTDQHLGIMHRYETALGDRQKRLWLAGLDQPTGNGSASASGNPTTFATTADHGVGFVALGDAFRNHVVNYALQGNVGIADYSLVLEPKGSYTAEWAIVPTDVPDYWRFLNAVRRLVGANFVIDGGFCFLRGGPLTEQWSDDQIADFIRFKDVLYVCTSITHPRYKGHYTHGTAFQLVPHDSYIAAGERFRRLGPGIKYLIYFHCFLDVTDEAPERFADSRTLRPDGTQADYGKPHQRLFFPTETNSYGPEIAKNVDIILDEIGADGVYWDEHEYSRLAYHFGEPWDGCSGNIDPKTMQVTRLKSSVTLLTEPWRLGLARSIMSRGPLVGNGPPRTKAMAALRFPCFVETGSITNCTRAHLHSPIALGDHLTERSEEDAYAVMLAALEYGCVYHWYNDVLVIPTHHHLTRYMYPITPMELHEGYIIGEERLITKKSGLYGWSDASKHEVHVFNDTGREVEDFNAPFLERDGKTYTELRLAEDWSAAIVRK